MELDYDTDVSESLVAALQDQDRDAVIDILSELMEVTDEEGERSVSNTADELIERVNELLDESNGNRTERSELRQTDLGFKSLDSSISPETRSELRDKLSKVVAGILLAVTLNTQVAFGNLLGMDWKPATNTPVVSTVETNAVSSSIAQSAQKVLQPQVIGILPHLARSFDIVAAVIANVAGQNKIVILAETPGQVQLIKDDVLAKMPEAYRENVVVETQIDRQIIFGDSKNTIFKPFGLPDDQSYFNEQVLKLLHDYKDRIEEKIAPREVIVGALGISDTIQTIASQAHALWFESIAA